MSVWSSFRRKTWTKFGRRYYLRDGTTVCGLGSAGMMLPCASFGRGGIRLDGIFLRMRFKKIVREHTEGPVGLAARAPRRSENSAALHGGWHSGRVDPDCIRRLVIKTVAKRHDRRALRIIGRIRELAKTLPSCAARYGDGGQFDLLDFTAPHRDTTRRKRATRRRSSRSHCFRCRRACSRRSARELLTYNVASAGD